MTNKLKIKKGVGDENKPEQIDEVAENKIFDSEGELVVDVFETDSNFVVLAAIAGIQIKDLDISVEKDMMVIKGNRQDPHLGPEKKYFYQECYWGPFSRKIVLPENIEVEKTAAQMDKGLLTIEIPKTEKSKIDVKFS
jgi:HSP20 family protein